MPTVRRVSRSRPVQIQWRLWNCCDRPPLDTGVSPASHLVRGSFYKMVHSGLSVGFVHSLSGAKNGSGLSIWDFICLTTVSTCVDARVHVHGINQKEQRMNITTFVICRYWYTYTRTRCVWTAIDHRKTAQTTSTYPNSARTGSAFLSCDSSSLRLANSAFIF